MSIASFNLTSEISAETDQTSQNVASDLVLHYFLTEYTFRILIKVRLPSTLLNLEWVCPAINGGKLHSE